MRVCGWYTGRIFSAAFTFIFFLFFYLAAKNNLLCSGSWQWHQTVVSEYSAYWRPKWLHITTEEVRTWHVGIGRESLNGLGAGWTGTRTQVAWLPSWLTTPLPTQPGLTQNKQPIEQSHKQQWVMDGQSKKQAQSNCNPITSWPLNFQASL